MSEVFPDQQPIGRIVGRRVRPPAGVPPSRETRTALDAWARRLSRVPKGVIRYANHDEMERDRQRWQTEAIVATLRTRG